MLIYLCLLHSLVWRGLPWVRCIQPLCMDSFMFLGPDPITQPEARGLRDVVSLSAKEEKTQNSVRSSTVCHKTFASIWVSSSVHFLIIILLPFFFGLSPYPSLYILISIYFLYILESTGSLLILSIANISSNLPDHFGYSLSSISNLPFYVTQ